MVPIPVMLTPVMVTGDSDPAEFGAWAAEKHPPVADAPNEM